MHYVDGFVVPVPRAKLDAYRALAQKAGEVWMEHGALQYFECVGDDVQPGKLTSFPQAVQLQDGEVAVFAWIVYASRAERDRINALVMKDPRIACDHCQEIVKGRDIKLTLKENRPTVGDVMPRDEAA